MRYNLQSKPQCNFHSINYLFPLIFGIVTQNTDTPVQCNTFNGHKKKKICGCLIEDPQEKQYSAHKSQL